MSDYRDIKKGIKRAQYDEDVKNINIFLSIVPAIIIGFIFHRWWVGLIAWIVFAVLITRHYYEFGSDKKR